MENQKYIELTEKIIKGYYTVYNKLGYGFLENVYEKALSIELTRMGLHAKTQVPIKVYYDDFEVGLYFADILVNDVVILELKAVQNISSVHEAQLYNYLKATGIEVGLLLNFGLEPKIRRRTLLEKK
ncbi:GxxExxY protein [Bernardetia sp. ABR2-2B]|uniref:GxxExxY protein n=1 Tax=Bernardetia sp. ABR2-2B TaxID=3127472 RepID=UPI0030CD5215